MITDGGGWTFIWHIDSYTTGDSFFTGIGSYRADRVDDGTKYSIPMSYFLHTEMMATIDSSNVTQSLNNRKIVFYKYTLWSQSFNTWPTPCLWMSNFSIRNLPQNKAVSGTWSSCSSTQWSHNISWQLATGFANNSPFWNFYWAGLWWNNTWNHDGWWYVR